MLYQRTFNIRKYEYNTMIRIAMRMYLDVSREQKLFLARQLEAEVFHFKDIKIRMMMGFILLVKMPHICLCSL